MHIFTWDVSIEQLWLCIKDASLISIRENSVIQLHKQQQLRAKVTALLVPS